MRVTCVCLYEATRDSNQLCSPQYSLGYYTPCRQAVQLLRMKGNASDGYYEREAEWRLVASSSSSAADAKAAATQDTTTSSSEAAVGVDVDVAFREEVTVTAVKEKKEDAQGEEGGRKD